MKFTSSADTLFAEVIEAVSAAGERVSKSIDAISGPVGRVPVSGSGAGSGAPANLVLLHPTPLDHRFWVPLVPYLSSYRLILPDLRGHGRSPLGDAPLTAGNALPALTVQQLALDVLALLDALGVERAVCVGCSIGGYTLYELWRIAPDRVSGLVFSNSKPQADNEAERGRREEWIAKHEAPRRQGQSSPTSEFVEAMLSSLLSETTRREQPRRVEEARAMMEQVRPEALQAIQRGLALRPDSRATARTITVPTCVLAGEHDVSSTPADMSALHDLVAGGGGAAEYHLIPGAGHYAPFEQPALIGAILNHFLQNHLCS